MRYQLSYAVKNGNKDELQSTNLCWNWDKLHFLVPGPTVIASKTNETAVSIRVSINGGKFDSGNVSFSPFWPTQTFDQSDLPVVLFGLTPSTNYTMTFVFGVGGVSNCGASGDRYSDPVVVQYQPGKYFCSKNHRKYLGARKKSSMAFLLSQFLNVNEIQN